jgi:NDP-sugar pyrophosphorylase family protein
MRPLTARLPKPLLPLAGRPLLTHLADRVVAAGAQALFANLHFEADRVGAHLTTLDLPIPTHTATEPTLTGPAGALRAFGSDLAGFDVLLVSSADVVLGDDLADLVHAHLAAGTRLTFAVVERDRARHFGVLDLDEHGRVVRAREKPDVLDHERHWISAGVYCVHPSLVAEIPADTVYDYARDLAPALLAAGEAVATHRCSGYWRDIGTPAALRAAVLDAVEGRIPWLPAAPVAADGEQRNGRVRIGAGARVASTAVLRGPADVGAGARIGEHAWVEDAVVFDGASMADGQVVIGGMVA